MTHRTENDLRVFARMAAAVLALPAALVLLVATPNAAQALADPIPSEFAAGFDVADPQPDWLLSPFLDDFLSVSTDPASGAAVIIDRTEQYVWEGSGAPQDGLQPGVGEFFGVSTWTVIDINIEVPENGLFLYIGGMAGPDYVPPPGTPPFDTYAQGSVQVLTEGGSVGGVTLPALDEALLLFGSSSYVYFGTVIEAVGDSLVFSYVGDDALSNGVPFFSNAGRNFVVPEPGSFLLVGAGLAMLASKRRGRARS